jgi:hypothetical protein
MELDEYTPNSLSIHKSRGQNIGLDQGIDHRNGKIEASAATKFAEIDKVYDIKDSIQELPENHHLKFSDIRPIVGQADTMLDADERHVKSLEEQLNEKEYENT